MRKWFRRYARGGRVPKTKPEGVIVKLAPGEVWCAERDCDWHAVGGSEIEQVNALAEHFREKHRDSYL